MQFESQDHPNLAIKRPRPCACVFGKRRDLRLLWGRGAARRRGCLAPRVEAKGGDKHQCEQQFHFALPSNEANCTPDPRLIVMAERGGARAHSPMMSAAHECDREGPHRIWRRLLVQHRAKLATIALEHTGRCCLADALLLVA